MGLFTISQGLWQTACLEKAKQYYYSFYFIVYLENMGTSIGNTTIQFCKFISGISCPSQHYLISTV